MTDSNSADFLLLLQIVVGIEKIKEQSGYNFSINTQDNAIFIFEPNATNPCDKIFFDTIVEEYENDKRRTNNQNLKGNRGIQHEQYKNQTRVESYAGKILERVRGILEERSRQSRGLSQTDNTIRYLLREQILTQQSTIDERLELKSLHTRYKELKDEAAKARAIKTYLELGGIANVKC